MTAARSKMVLGLLGLALLLVVLFVALFHRLPQEVFDQHDSSCVGRCDGVCATFCTQDADALRDTSADVNYDLAQDATSAAVEIEDFREPPVGIPGEDGLRGYVVESVAFSDGRTIRFSEGCRADIEEPLRRLEPTLESEYFEAGKMWPPVRVLPPADLDGDGVVEHLAVVEGFLIPDRFFTTYLLAFRCESQSGLAEYQAGAAFSERNECVGMTEAMPFLVTAKSVRIGERVLLQVQTSCVDGGWGELQGQDSLHLLTFDRGTQRLNSAFSCPVQYERLFSDAPAFQGEGPNLAMHGHGAGLGYQNRIMPFEGRSDRLVVMRRNWGEDGNIERTRTIYRWNGSAFADPDGNSSCSRVLRSPP